MIGDLLKDTLKIHVFIYLLFQITELIWLGQIYIYIYKILLFYILKY